jgi:hypothetical protein
VRRRKPGGWLRPRKLHAGTRTCWSSDTAAILSASLAGCCAREAAKVTSEVAELDAASSDAWRMLHGRPTGSSRRVVSSPAGSSQLQVGQLHSSHITRRGRAALLLGCRAARRDSAAGWSASLLASPVAGRLQL